MAIHRPAPDLSLVDLDQALDGFRTFIGSWVLRRHGTTVLVDPGPRATIPELDEALAFLGVERLDAILLTHVHIDHAGGTGLLCRSHPEARVLCHPKGVPHLVDPSKLWAGSQKILGAVAEAYGAIEPVPEAALVAGTGDGDPVAFGPLRVVTWDTPGHAAHHLAFQVDEFLFPGEAVGVRHPLDGGPYQRPATPPVFFYDVYRRSLDRLAGRGASHLCFGHYGHTAAVEEAFATARDQLETWVATVARHLEAGSAPLEDAVFAELLRTDPVFARFTRLPADVQRRERYFFANTVAGLRGYLEQGAA